MNQIYHMVQITCCKPTSTHIYNDNGPKLMLKIKVKIT